MTLKYLEYIKVNNVSPLYLIINIIIMYFEEINRNKYVIKVLNNESKEIIKKHGELLSKNQRSD